MDASVVPLIHQRGSDMNLYIISMRRDDDSSRSPAELTRIVEGMERDIEIVSGRDKPVMTVQMARDTASVVSSAIPFAKVENYFELDLLQ